MGPLAGLAVARLIPDAMDGVGGLDRVGRITAGVGALMAVWWLTEAVPLSATALAPIATPPVPGARGSAR